MQQIEIRTTHVNHLAEPVEGIAYAPDHGHEIVHHHDGYPAHIHRGSVMYTAISGQSKQDAEQWAGLTGAADLGKAVVMELPDNPDEPIKEGLVDIESIPLIREMLGGTSWQGEPGDHIQAWVCAYTTPVVTCPRGQFPMGWRLSSKMAMMEDPEAKKSLWITEAWVGDDGKLGDWTIPVVDLSVEDRQRIKQGFGAEQPPTKTLQVFRVGVDIPRIPANGTAGIDPDGRWTAYPMGWYSSVEVAMIEGNRHLKGAKLWVSEAIATWDSGKEEWHIGEWSPPAECRGGSMVE